jgi:transposase
MDFYVNLPKAGLIRDLYSQGFCISEIARQTGFDKKTVKKYLR